MEFDAVILAGGSGSRMGGRDKAELTVGGRRLLDIALDAVEGAARIVVVGPRRATARGSVIWRREDPPGGGPVAALAAGLAEVVSRRVVVLAVDLPFATPHAVRTLLAAAGETDGAMAIDDDGRDQPLFAVYGVEVLRRALAAVDEVPAASMRKLVGSLGLDRVEVGRAARDCDTLEDLGSARAER